MVALFRGMPEEGLVPDYDSYSAVIRSFLKETMRAYRQFAASHPGESRRSMHPALRTAAGARCRLQT